MRSSMQKPIPADMRAEMDEDPFMHRCCLADNTCEGRIEWHHNLIYAGKRVNEKWAVLPCCHYHHTSESHFKEQLNKIMCSRASVEDLEKYSKAIDYVAIKHGTT